MDTLFLSNKINDSLGYRDSVNLTMTEKMHKGCSKIIWDTLYLYLPTGSSMLSNIFYFKRIVGDIGIVHIGLLCFLHLFYHIVGEWQSYYFIPCFQG